jgi:hypothetical protein
MYLPSIKHGQFDATPANEERHAKECPCLNEVECPKCKSLDIVWDYVCHTYGPPWMACMDCDSAVDYYCRENTCDWRYTDGLNSRNPRAEENAKKRPAWLDDEQAVQSRKESTPVITWWDPRVKDARG